MGTTRLAGRTAWVTGAGGGIGAAVARRLAEEGAVVLVTDLDDAAAQAVAARIGDAGGRAEALAVDVTDSWAASAAADRAAELDGGGIHVLVNNAGVIRPAMFDRMDLADFQLVVDVHVMGLVHCSRAALPHLPDDGTGRIINVTSAAGLQGTVGQANYGAAKAAVIGLTKSLAKELARRAITVNAVAPLAATQMTETVRTDPRFAEQTLARIPLNRWAEPEEIAGTFAFLASDDAAYITGQVLPVDGGLVM